MAKAPPAFQFYPGDWLSDPEVSRCPPAVRGIWIDILCAMHLDGACGKLCGNLVELSRISRCTPDEMAETIAVLKAQKVADVTQRRGRVTIINRRMQKQAKLREQNRLRQRRYRE